MYTTTVQPPVPQPQKYKLRQWLRKWATWTVTTTFSAKHPQIDLARGAGTLGAAVLAPFDAVVDIVNWTDDRGWYLYLYDETQGIEWFGCHFMQEPAVSRGERVKAGQVVAFVGNTGKSTGPHIHSGACRVDANLSIIEWLDPLGARVEILSQ